MRRNQCGIATGGEQRLRVVIEAEVRKKHEEQLAAATDHWVKISIEEQIRKEVKERMKRVVTPHSLWSSRGKIL